MKLNPEQLKAVRHRRGPLLIVAGAGTGKTTVITERIKHLIKTKGERPEEILAVTFTEKAAEEMLERLDVVMPLGYQEPWLCTFHALCDRILKAEALEMGLDPGYTILSKPEQWILIRKHLFDLPLKLYRPLGNPTKFISSLVTFFSRAQDEGVTPEVLVAFAKKARLRASTAADKEEAGKLEEVAKSYRVYQTLKTRESLVDFGDLITLTIKLLREHPAILRKYRKQFHHLLVDEFQDTNYAQYELIKLLAPAGLHPNLVVVGDDDQSIYKFRGASVSNILEFKKDYPQAKKVVLSKNYRSLKPILETAYRVIVNNNPDRLETKLNINKKLAAVRKGKGFIPQIVSLPSGEDETEWVTERILTLFAQTPYTYKDVAVLTRANKELDAFIATFKRHGLPYQVVGNRGLFDQEEVRELMLFLKLVVDPTDSVNLFQFVSSSLFTLPEGTILDLLKEANRVRTPLWSVLQGAKTPAIHKLVKLVEAGQHHVNQMTPTRLLYHFLQETHFIKRFIEPETLENQLKIKNVNLFLRFIKRLEGKGPEHSVIAVVDFLQELEEAGANPGQAEIEDIDTITLMTLHAAKGLEFPIVFIPSLVAGRFPAINRQDPILFPEKLIKEILPHGDENIQEERRLFYVGMTRARDYLFLTHAKDYGGVRERRPSGFLSETKLKTEIVAQTPILPELKGTPPPPLTVQLGAKVKLPAVSYSQIDTFKTCPLKYKYRYVLHVPAKPHHTLTFGQSIHDTLLHFHRLEQQGKRPTLKTLLTLYRRFFRAEGYESAHHREARQKSGERALRRYVKVYRRLLGKPVNLERTFQLGINGVKLIGTIDRIDQRDGEYEIIDYKTGTAFSKKDVGVDEQLSIYALGAKEALKVPVRRLSLYFIEANKKLSTTRSEKEIRETLKRLKGTTTEMQRSQFPAKPGYPFPCHYCDYNKICPFAAKPRA